MYQKYLNEILLYEKRIGLFFSRHNLSSEEREDLKQESLCRIYESISNFKGSSSLGTWIFSICKNVLYEFFRNKKKLIQLDNYEIEVPDKTDYIVIEILVQNLPEYLKPVYQRKYKQNLKIKDIARELSMAEGTVKYYIHLIKKHLREYI